MGCPMKSRLDATLRAICALIPAVVALAGVSSTPLAAHDDGVIRTIGVGSTGLFRALDLLLAAPAVLLPFGTRAFRAGLVGPLLTAVAGYLAFDIARALVSAAVPAVLRNVGDKKAERLLSAVSAIAVLTALLAPPWQTEASAPGGSVAGAVLVIVALSLSTRSAAVQAAPVAAMALVAGLAATYEPLVLAAVVAACAPTVVRARKAITSAELVHAAVMFVLGLVPFAVALAMRQRAPEVSLVRPALELGGAISPLAFPLGEIGWVLLGLGALGIALSSTRPAAIPLILVLLVGAGALVLHARSGPNRYAPVLLAALCAFYILSGTALAVVVLAIARARVPFAEASAALVVLLELVLPVRAADETSARRASRAPYAAAIWNDVAWGSSAPGAIVLVHDRGTMGRIASARATGDFRGDLVVVPAYDVQSREGERALLAEPKLAPLYRDMALVVAPEELSLAQLGAQRPVYSNFDPKWDRALSRHLVPTGLTARFEPEPRGSSDRKRALDALTATKDRLVRIMIAKKDAELASATVTLLRARAVGMAATGEREVLAQALEDLRAFAADDPVSAALVRRIVTTKGAIDVKDLKPYP